jgi:REP element-mobilizing transposase RayT
MVAKFDPQKHHRRSIRVQGYDYTQSGAYYVTIVAYQRQHFFGEVVNGEMRLNALGQIARDEWFKTATLRPYVELYEDEFIVMPNHVHGIIWIHHEMVGVERRSAPTPASTLPNVPPKSLGAIVRAYKSAVTYAINTLQNQRGAGLWQRNYYEHIIRDEKDLQAKRDYILSNPMSWDKDDENVS